MKKVLFILLIAVLLVALAAPAFADTTLNFGMIYQKKGVAYGPLLSVKY
jgi:hypothetical protein